MGLADVLLKSASRKEEDLKSRELAQSYQTMLQTAAWKDLTKEIDRIYADSNKTVDDVEIAELNLAIVGKGVGIREVIRKIRGHVDYRINGVGF